jgi:hypothetical protein
MNGCQFSPRGEPRNSEGFVLLYYAVFFSHNKSTLQLLTHYFSLTTNTLAYTVHPRPVEHSEHLQQLGHE